MFIIKSKSRVRISIGEMMGMIAVLALIFTACRIHWFAAAMAGLWMLPTYARTVGQRRADRHSGRSGGPWEAIGLFVCWAWACAWELIKIAVILGLILDFAGFVQCGAPQSPYVSPIILFTITAAIVCYISRIISHDNIYESE